MGPCMELEASFFFLIGEVRMCNSTRVSMRFNRLHVSIETMASGHRIAQCRNSGNFESSHGTQLLTRIPPTDFHLSLPHVTVFEHKFLKAGPPP